MKMQLSIILLSLVFSSCQGPVFEKVSNSTISQPRLEIAEQLTKKLMTAMSNGNYYKLTSSEATPKMVQAFTEKLQKQSYEQIRNLFGEYQGHQFRELWKSKEDSQGEIYRFKAQFKSSLKIEIRTVLDNDGKLAGFFIRPWKENL